MKLEIFVGFCLIGLLWSSATIAQSDDEEMCFPFRRSSPQRPTVGKGLQGRPGKIGPEGPPGPPGSQGIPGKCGCDPSEIDQLYEKIQRLTESTIQLAKTVSMFISELPVDFYVSHCAVGLKDGRVLDADITASSIYTVEHAADHGRLDYNGPPIYSSSWSALTSRRGEWIQVDLNTRTYVTGVVTQGRGDYSQWITRFKISHGNSTSELSEITDKNGEEKIFSGNSDRNTHVLNRFPQPIVARYFRLTVLEWISHVSIRLEYITC